MRRVSLVTLLAAAVVVGHLAYHLIPKPASQPPTPSALEPSSHATMPVVVDVPAPEPVPCSAYAPIRPAEWKLMSASLQPLVETDARRSPKFAKYEWEFFRRFEICAVDIREQPNYLLVATPFDSFWTGARFSKTSRGWIALDLVGGEFR
jgi:thiol-disulfide isomerase/thioredoxin